MLGCCSSPTVSRVLHPFSHSNIFLLTSGAPGCRARRHEKQPSKVESLSLPPLPSVYDCGRCVNLGEVSLSYVRYHIHPNTLTSSLVDSISAKSTFPIIPLRQGYA